MTPQEAIDRLNELKPLVVDAWADYEGDPQGLAYPADEVRAILAEVDR